MKVGLVVAACALLFGCSGTAKPPPPEEPVPKTVPDEPKLGLRLVVVPPDAEVVVDAKSYGLASDLSEGFIELPAGLYGVSVKRDGYQTWRAEVTVRDAIERLEIELTPVGSN